MKNVQLFPWCLFSSSRKTNLESKNCSQVSIVKISFYYVRIIWLVAGIILSSSHLLLAQQDYFQYGKDGRKGYWKVTTDPQTRSTEVTFFNQQGELLYREILKNKYLKLNSKNTHILNKQLTCLTENSLVAAEIKSSELEASTKYFSKEIIESNRMGIAITHHASGYLSSKLRYSIYTVQRTTALVLIMDNPAQERLVIRIKDHSGRTLYIEQTYLGQYRREIQLNKMQAGTYFLVVTAKKHKIRHKLTITSNEPLKQILLVPHI
jgi:hypothetical protein